MQNEVTLMLERAARGDSTAFEELIPVVYEELRRLAGAAMGRQPSSHTLQPTALVHEVYAKLVRGDKDYANRAHFMAVASLAMRQILTDYARRRKAARRGGEANREGVDVDAVMVPDQRGTFDPVALSDALEKLGEMSERRRRVVELRFFGGLTMPQVAEVLSISVSTAEADWRSARAWLASELTQQDES